MVNGSTQQISTWACRGVGMTVGLVAGLLIATGGWAALGAVGLRLAAGGASALELELQDHGMRRDG